MHIALILRLCISDVLSLLLHRYRQLRCFFFVDWESDIFVKLIKKPCIVLVLYPSHYPVFIMLSYYYCIIMLLYCRYISLRCFDNGQDLFGNITSFGDKALLSNSATEMLGMPCIFLYRTIPWRHSVSAIYAVRLFLTHHSMEAQC